MKENEAIEREVSRLMATWEKQLTVLGDRRLAETRVLCAFAEVCRAAVDILGDRATIDGINNGNRYILLGGYALGSEGLYKIEMDGNLGRVVAVPVHAPEEIGEHNAKPYLAAQELARRVVSGCHGRQQSIDKSLIRIAKMRALSEIIANFT